MSKSHHEKNLFCLPSTTKNSTVSRFHRLCKRLAVVIVRWGLAPFTPFSILWRRKGWLNPVGETKDERIAVGQDDVITNLLGVELQPWKQFSLSDQTSSIGSLSSRDLAIEKQPDEEPFHTSHVGDNLIHPSFGVGRVIEVFGVGRQTCLAIKFDGNRTKIIDPFLVPMQSQETVGYNWHRLNQALESQEVKIKLLERASALEKRRRKYKRSDPVETWVSRWIASPVSYLFPEARREEWLGDLYELHREMFRKEYPRWLINLMDLGRTVILIVSAFRIKLSDFFSMSARKGL
jgi:hypothetical protein